METKDKPLDNVVEIKLSIRTNNVKLSGVRMISATELTSCVDPAMLMEEHFRTLKHQIMATFLNTEVK